MEKWRPVTIDTARGEVETHYYEALGAGAAAVWVGGIGGGWDTPARGLYPNLCEELQGLGISSLRVRFRHPTDLDESESDVLAGLGFLDSQGVTRAALTGHSFGGAVVIRAAARSEMVKVVVTLSTQSYGAGAVATLSGVPILVIHGSDDTVLPPSSSRHVYDMAGEPRRLVILEGAGHVLDETADDVYGLVRDWILEKLLTSP